MPPSRADLATEWRRSFVRASTAKVLAQIRKAPDVDAILRANWPTDERARLIVRGAVEPLKQAGMPGNVITQLIALSPESAAARLFQSAVQIDLTGTSQFSFPFASSFDTAAFIEEGMPIPVGQGVFAGMPLGPIKKIAMIAALTAELEYMSIFTAALIIEHVLKVAVGRGLDAVLFDNIAGDDIRPAGLLHGVTPITPTAGGDFKAMNADLRGLVAQISDAGVDV